MSRKILLADDSLTIQKVVELTFAETDYEVIAVSSGDELLERLPEAQPDIVICDVIMPGRDGYDVCQEIKSGPDTLHLPVILLTGTFEPFDRDRALAAGCSEIITKPFEARKMVETVEKLFTATGAPPPPSPEEQEDVAEFDGQVTAPPPIAAPEITFEPDDEGELEETDVGHDFDAEEPAAEAPEVPVAAEAEQSEADFFAEETPVFVAAAVSVALEPGDEDSFELPDVEGPPDPKFFANQPQQDLDTLASDGRLEVADAAPDLDIEEEDDEEEEQAIEVMEDPFSSETEEEQPGESGDEVFGPEAEDMDPYQTESPELDEAAKDEESDHQMTTPIDVAAVMAEGGFEEEWADESEDVGSIEWDPSDADTQDVTDQAEGPAEPAEVEAPVETFEPEAPVEPVAVEAPSDPFAEETPVESFAAEEPAISFEADVPTEPLDVETPGESFTAEDPAGPSEADLPAEPVEVETPAETVTVKAPAKPVAVEAASLSDDDVDRIARRLLELAGDRIEHIAWDVIPDMAELVVRERVRELEAEAEQ